MTLAINRKKEPPREGGETSPFSIDLLCREIHPPVDTDHQTGDLILVTAFKGDRVFRIRGDEEPVRCFQKQFYGDRVSCLLVEEALPVPEDGGGHGGVDLELVNARVGVIDLRVHL